MGVQSFRLIQRRAVTLNPSVRLKFCDVLLYADAKLRRNSLARQQMYQHQRLFQARRISDSVSRRGTHHSRRQRRALR